MKTIFDDANRQQLVARIGMLNDNSKAQWGKMTVYQMLKHNTLWEEMMLSNKQCKQVFIGRLFGKTALKSMVKDDTPMKKNMPTVKGFDVKGNGDVAAEKSKWVMLLQQHAQLHAAGSWHPFFGFVTREQGGCLAYKHTDHHLRQFGV